MNARRKELETLEKELEELHERYDYAFICGCEIRAYQDWDCEQNRVHIIPCQKHLGHLFIHFLDELKDFSRKTHMGF